MKRILSLVLATFIFINLISISVFSRTNSDLESQEKKIEEKYGIQLSIQQKILDNEPVYKHILSIIDQTYGRFPEGLVKEVTDYFKKKNISTIVKVRYYALSEFDIEDGMFEIDNKQAVLTYRVGGELSAQEELGCGKVAHDMAHLIHRFIEDKYGYSKFKEKWGSLNGEYSYASKDNPYKGTILTYDDGWSSIENPLLIFARVFSTTSYSDDFATTIEELVANPDLIRELLTNHSDCPLAKKIALINEVLVQYSDSVDENQKLWYQATPQIPSSWAVNLMNKALANNLIPEEFAGLYTSNITREDFCKLIMSFFEQKTQSYFSELLEAKGIQNNWYDNSGILPGGEGMRIDRNYPFVDIYDLDIFDLYASDVFVGLELDRYFNPTKDINREEAVSIMYNIIKIFDESLIKSSSNYDDSSQISNWAKDAVDFVTTNKIMGGIGENKFAPKEKLTYEQAYIIMLRLLEYYTKEIPVVSVEAEFIIEPKYDTAKDFSEGLAFVSRDNKYFFIDRRGNEIIALPYKEPIEAREFKNGLALITIHKPDTIETTLIVIDKDGREVFKTDNVYATDIYEIYDDFMNGKRFMQVLCKDPDTQPEQYNMYYVDFKGSKYLKDEYGELFEFNEYGLAKFGWYDKYGVINNSGNIIVKPGYWDVSLFSDGYILVKCSPKGGDWGIFDKNGNEIVKVGKYDTPSYSPLIIGNSIFFRGKDATGLIDKTGAFLYKHDNNKYIDMFSDEFICIYKDSMYVILDSSGDEVYSFDERFSSMSEGLAVVGKNSKLLIIDDSFNEVAELENSDYLVVKEFKDGVANVFTRNNLWGTINKQGKEIITPKYKTIDNFSYGIALIKDNNKYGCVNKTGEIILEPAYNFIEIGNGMICARKDSKYTLFNNAGEVILEECSSTIYIAKKVPIINKWVEIEGNAFAKVTDSNTRSFFYINKFGNQYDEITPAGDGMIRVANENNQGSYSYGFCDANGEPITDVHYQCVIDFDTDLEDAARVMKDYKWGVINKNGKEIIPVKFGSIGKFVNGIAPAGRIKYGYIDINGNEVIKYLYDNVGDFSEGLAYVNKNGKYGYIKHPYK